MTKRLKFFLGHLLVSIGIALLFVGVVFLCWYPSPLAKAVGVTHIFLMLIAIDVIVGPVLGLLVYKEGKKTLKIDLTVIIVLQLSALCYGVYSIAQARPVWIVFNHDKFELVRNNQIKTDNIDKAQLQYQHPSWFKPQYVAIQHANDPQQIQIEQMNAILNGVSLAEYPDRYIAIDQVKDNILSSAQDLTKLEQWNDKGIIYKYLNMYPQANAWLPLETYDVPMVILIDRKNAEIIKIVDLRPSKSI